MNRIRTVAAVVAVPVILLTGGVGQAAAAPSPVSVADAVGNITPITAGPWNWLCSKLPMGPIACGWN